MSVSAIGKAIGTMAQESSGVGGLGGIIPGAIIGGLWTKTFTGAMWGALIGGVGIPIFVIFIFLTWAILHAWLNAPPARVRVEFKPRVEELKTQEELWDEHFNAYLAENGKKREDVHS